MTLVVITSIRGYAVKSIRTLIGATALAVAIVGAMSVPAVAEVQENIQTFKNLDTGLCLDDTPEGGLRTFTCNNTVPQKFRVRSDGRIVELRSERTKLCVDDTREANIRHWTCNNTDAQRWSVTRYPDKSISFRNLDTGLCMDDTREAGLRHFVCNGTPAQRWV
ncbi:hypothetical protein D5S17_35270 [Pseudonocardiaceae bacterium YIM PH 21723]|nr:hypothetical protein D5S17_35270 [Pseudonocardiaceae bacterium YIM PH 21723]